MDPTKTNLDLPQVLLLSCFPFFVPLCEALFKCIWLRCYINKDFRPTVINFLSRMTKKQHIRAVEHIPPPRLSSLL